VTRRNRKLNLQRGTKVEEEELGRATEPQPQENPKRVEGKRVPNICFKIRE